MPGGEGVRLGAQPGCAGRPPPRRGQDRRPAGISADPPRAPTDDGEPCDFEGFAPKRRHHETRLLRDKLDEGLVEIEALRHGIEALHDVGIYNYRHPLEDAVAHQQALAEISAEMKSRIAEGTAIEVSTRFTFDNSLAEGRKMTSELAKLMLRAYNVEAENCVRYVKAGNLTGAERRLTNNAPRR